MQNKTLDQDFCLDTATKAFLILLDRAAADKELDAIDIENIADLAILGATKVQTAYDKTTEGIESGKRKQLLTQLLKNESQENLAANFLEQLLLRKSNIKKTDKTENEKRSIIW